MATEKGISKSTLRSTHLNLKCPRSETVSHDGRLLTFQFRMEELMEVPKDFTGQGSTAFFFFFLKTESVKECTHQKSRKRAAAVRAVAVFAEDIMHGRLIPRPSPKVMLHK